MSVGNTPENSAAKCIAPPLSLYIHFPWCVKKCPYCDFNSHRLNQTLPEEEYIEALKRNLDHHRSYIANRSLHSIFMGGGTPSLFSERAIDQLLNYIQRHLPCNDNMEITLEANPGTVDQTRFKGYFQAGVNRISLGVQSFHDHHLHTLGRIHSAEQANLAAKAIKQAGFERFNVDLMFGLPQQTLEEGLADLQAALTLEPDHLSWYELTIEPNTLFWHQRPSLPEEESIIELHQQGQRYLEANGFMQYEVSAYTRQDPCQHNVNYWQFGDYLAIGAGSHGKATLVESQEIIRYHHFRSPKQYMDSVHSFVQGQQMVPLSQLPFEFMLNALRLTKGVPTQIFCERTGLALSTIQKPLHVAYQKGWLEDPTTTLCATPEGYRFLNDLISLFLCHAN